MLFLEIMPKRTPKIKNTPVAIDLAKVREHAYSMGVHAGMTTRANDTISRSYNSFSSDAEALGSSPTVSATEMLMNGSPIQTKDNTGTKRTSEIKLSRALTDANVHAARYLQIANARLIGQKGPTLITKLSYVTYKDGKPVDTVHQIASRVVGEAYKEFSRPYNVDVAGLRHWNDFIFEDVGTGLPRDGSLLWVLHTFNPLAPDAPNAFGTMLQQFDTVYIARNLNMAYDAKLGRRINNGVELDKFGRRIALYLDLSKDFQDKVGTEVVKDYVKSIQGNNYNAPSSYVRIPYADETDDAYEGLSVIAYDNDPSPLPNQTAGRPWGYVTFESIHSDEELSRYLKVAARAGASKAIAVTKNADGKAPIQNIVHNQSGQVKGVNIMPGQVNFLDEGQSIQSIDFDLPYDGTLKFTTKILKGVAAALAVPYSELTNDYSESTFATEHSANIRNNRLWSARREHIKTVLLNPFLRLWFRRCVRYNVFKYGTQGSYTVLDKDLMLSMIDGVSFEFDAYEHQSPLDYEKAVDLRLRNGTSTLHDEILKRGQNPEDVLTRRIEEVERLKENGVFIEGYTFFSGMGSNAPDAFVYSKELNKKIELIEESKRVDAKRLLEATIKEKGTTQDANDSIARSMHAIERQIATTSNVQQSILRELTSVDEQITRSSRLKLDAPKVVEFTQPLTKMRTFTAVERSDGTYDLNTLRMLEQDIMLKNDEPVVTPTVIDIELPEISDENKVVLVKKDMSKEEAQDILDSLIAEVESIANI